MRRLIYLLTAFDCFAIGVGAVLLFSYWTAVPDPEAATQTVETVEMATVDVKANDETEGSTDPLEEVWERSGHLEYLDYRIEKECPEPKPSEGMPCSFVLSNGKKTLDDFEIIFDHDDWVQFGLFDFLGTRTKQLVVQTYSGGAHCCHDYVVYDLDPKFRAIYDSRLQDSGGEVGDELLPMDLDGDGVYEFRRNVMAFDYWFSSHAVSTFPPAIFQYVRRSGKYRVANKKFKGTIKAELYKWNEDEDSTIRDTEFDVHGEGATRSRILYLIYAGERGEAWRIFEREYNFSDKQRFKSELKKILASDPTYQAIYSGR
jgi:hypothetical protein